MASYNVRIKAVAERQLYDLPFPFRRSVSHAIGGLKREPRPPQSEPLPKPGAYRLRVAGCRVVYVVDDESALVRVIRVTQAGIRRRP